MTSNSEARRIARELFPNRQLIDAIVTFGGLYASFEDGDEHVPMGELQDP